ncbi:MAG TPA: carboxypeptidase [Phycisphaerales bacterium]|nr:carboxypeptidase [Phycisphaerales bacterium]
MSTQGPLIEMLRGAIEPRRDEMIADLARFVAIPTGRNHAPGLDEFRALVTARLEALGARTESFPGDSKPSWLSDEGNPGPSSSPLPVSVACTRDAPGTPRILLAGHLDTVFDPRGSFQRLTIAPDGRTATGPGVVDMKGGILIALVALESLAQCGVDLPWTFFLNSDEETGTYHSASALRRLSPRYAYGIALEPALPGGALAIERKGSGQFMIESRGLAAHAGRDFFAGESAVYALAAVLTRVASMSDQDRGLTVNVGPLKGGEAANIVPDYAAAWGNVRFPDPRGADELAASLDALATAPDDMPSITVRRSFNRPAKPITPAAERLALTARRCAESLGQSLPFAATGGVCDGNIMQDAGLPTIDSMGVRGGGLHTSGEWIELDSLTERALLLAVLLEHLARAGTDEPR